MKFTRDQKQGAYRKLSPEVQDLIMSNEVVELITNSLKEAGLTEEQSVLADSEILYAMYGLQPFSTAMTEIAKLSNKTSDNLSKLKLDLEKNIFSKITFDTKILSTMGEEKFSVGKESPIIAIGKIVQNKESEAISNKTEKQEIVKDVKSSIRIGDTGNTPTYVTNLPASIQEVVFDEAWMKRTEEISRKYTLDSTQTDTLTSNVLMVILGLDKPEDFLKLMTSELGISRLLADQIIEDLEMRVFEYALKTIENKERKNITQPEKLPETKVAPQAQSNSIVPTIETVKVPEVKPIILPMVEKGEVAHNVPALEKKVETPAYKPTFNAPVEVKTVEKVESKINYNPVSKSTETVQKPLSVPRFTGIKTEETITGPAEKSIPQPTSSINFIEKKLNIPKPEIENKPPVTVPATEKPLVKNYAVDPYREPME